MRTNAVIDIAVLHAFRKSIETTAIVVGVFVVAVLVAASVCVASVVVMGVVFTVTCPTSATVCQVVIDVRF